MVMAEAMAMERPVVALDAYGASDIVLDGETGRLLPAPGDPAKVAAAIVELLDDPGRAAEMGRKGRARVESNFSSVAYRRFEPLFERLLSGA
jgi:glycosyltransferase involved in cell wall biosynthesis